MFKLASQRQIDAALLLLRAVVGIVFIAHGAQKLFVFGLDNLAAAFAQMGVPFPGLTGLMVAGLEFGGGMLLVAGVLTRLVSLGLAITMIGAIFLAHIEAGFFLPDGYEFALTLLSTAAMLMLTGAGRLSVDGVIARRSGESVRR